VSRWRRPAACSKIPYIAFKPNFLILAIRDKPNIPRQLATLRRLSEIGFVWVCYGPKLALDWLPAETEKGLAQAEFPNELNLTSDKYGPSLRYPAHTGVAGTQCDKVLILGL
jgi:hypothetical protein